MSALQRVRTLGRDLAVYGAGDVATQVLRLLLLPLYVRYLSPGDYGVLALTFALFGATSVFVPVYAALGLAEGLYLVLALVKWFREMDRLPR